MTIAKGQSSTIIELEIFRETLENMISSTEMKFRNIIDSLKAKIFDLEHDNSIGQEELKSLTSPFYSELEKFQSQIYISRNKLVICIYSICEAILRDICTDYHFVLLKEIDSNKKSDLDSNINSCKGDVKKKKKTYYYLNDYLYTINPNYKVDWDDAFIVSTVIKDLRNYLTHGNTKVDCAIRIVEGLSNTGFNNITQLNGQIIFINIESIHQILRKCYEMLISAEQIAKSKSKI